MSTITQSFNTTHVLSMRTTRVPTAPPYPVLKQTLVKTTGGLTRVVNRVDPLRKLLHGPYRREGNSLRVYPNITADLKYWSGGGIWDTYPRRDYHCSVSGCGHGYFLPQTRWLTVAESRRDQLINNCIKGAQEQLVNLAMFIGELDKTAGLLADKASRISSAAADIRKGKFSRAARTLNIRKPRGARRSKTFANNWLEFTYGWSPIVNDMVGMLQHLQRGSRTMRITARSRFTTSVPLSESTVVRQIAGGTSEHSLWVEWKASGVWKQNEQVVLVFEPLSAFWDQVSRLGFMNPGQLAWEAVPLSFVVDWFANVGDWLSGINLGLTLRFVTGSYTEFHKLEGDLVGRAFWSDYNVGTYRYASETCHVQPAPFQDHKLRRSTLSGQSVAVTFQLGVPTSVNQAITSVALAVQRLK